MKRLKRFLWQLWIYLIATIDFNSACFWSREFQEKLQNEEIE